MSALEMAIDRVGITDSGKAVPAGTVVTYLSHTLGGMVRVLLPSGERVILHPHCFARFRPGSGISHQHRGASE